MGIPTHQNLTNQNKISLLAFKSGALVFSGIFFWMAFSNPVWSKEKTYTKDGLTVSFPRMINITDDNHDELEGELSDLEIDHPVEINESFTRNHLLALWYQWVEPPGKPKPVFTTEEAERLGHLFRSALRKVRQEQYIHFEFQSKEGITEGEVFSSYGKIHWRFIRIHGAYFMKKFLGTSRATWKMIRRVRGQSIRVEKTALLKVKRENWIVADIKLAAPRPRPKTSIPANKPVGDKGESKSPSTSNKASPSIEKKLQSLKNLLDKGLITPKDYDRKKKAILNKHF